MATLPAISVTGTIYSATMDGGFSLPLPGVTGALVGIPRIYGGFVLPKIRLTDGWQVETFNTVPTGHGVIFGGFGKVHFPVRRFTGSGGVVVGIPDYATAGTTPLWTRVSGTGWGAVNAVVIPTQIGGWVGTAKVSSDSRARFIPWVPAKQYTHTAVGGITLTGDTYARFYSRQYTWVGGITLDGAFTHRYVPTNAVKLFPLEVYGQAQVLPRSGVVLQMPVVDGAARYEPLRVTFPTMQVHGAFGRELRGGFTANKMRISGLATQGNRIAFIPPEVQGAGNVYPAGKGTVALPLLEVKAKGHASESIRATIVFPTPVIEATAASIAPGQGLVTFRHGRVAASLSTTVDGVSFRKPVVAATLRNPKSFKAKVRFTAPTVHGAGAGVAGSGRVVFKRLQARSVLDRPLIATGNVVLRKPKLTSTLLLLKVSSGAVVFNTSQLKASMVIATNAEGAVRLYAAVVSGSGAEAQITRRAYAVNLATGAVSELPGYGFESMSGMWAAGVTDLEHLEGFTDAGENILARALGGTTEHGTPSLKRALALYVKSTFHPETKSDLRAIAEADGVERTYRTAVGFGAGVATRRAQLGRGVMASSWRYGFEVDYQDNFAVVSFTPEATVTSRGV